MGMKHRASAFANFLIVATCETVHVGRPPSQSVPLRGTDLCGVRECFAFASGETPHIFSRALPCTHQEEIISSWTSITIFWFANALALLCSNRVGRERGWPRGFNRVVESLVPGNVGVAVHFCRRYRSFATLVAGCQVQGGRGVCDIVLWSLGR